MSYVEKIISDIIFSTSDLFPASTNIWTTNRHKRNILYGYFLALSILRDIRQRLQCRERFVCGIIIKQSVCRKRIAVFQQQTGYAITICHGGQTPLFFLIYIFNWCIIMECQLPYQNNHGGRRVFFHDAIRLHAVFFAYFCVLRALQIFQCDRWDRNVHLPP